MGHTTQFQLIKPNQLESLEIIQAIHVIVNVDTFKNHTVSI